MRSDLLLLTPLARLGDLGLLLLRWVTGAFLVWQSHDNIFSAARILVFLGLSLATLGAGRCSIDARLKQRR
jgi:uncharacterized membrane protein YphA (DoxX/SURF4 family)